MAGPTSSGAQILASRQAPSTATARARPVGWWLLGCAAMVFAMAVIGAITRLTESGLSIMEWAPISGALPPLDDAEWRRLFALYQEIPEYQQLNAGMSLEEFRRIFWWEWIHRLWGRLIGVVFLLPFLWFLLARRIPPGLAPHLAGLFLLGGLQGALGWFMVASGFAERTDVSQYRLAAHLALALAIYAYLLWVALGLLWPRPGMQGRARGLRSALLGLTGLVALTIVSGAFVAGLNAGLIYNSFPLMDSRLVPTGYDLLDPWWLNLFENVAAVQFNHRLLAVTSVLLALALAGLGAATQRAPELRLAMIGVGAAALLQFGLGIATLLAVVPVWLGALHQAGAILLLSALLVALHALRSRASLTFGGQATPAGK